MSAPVLADAALLGAERRLPRTAHLRLETDVAHRASQGIHNEADHDGVPADCDPCSGNVTVSATLQRADTV